MEWQAFITRRVQSTGQTVSYGEPAAPDDLRRLEQEFRFRLPPAYRELLAQANGVFDEHHCPIVDSVASVIELNRTARSLTACMPLDHLFFISSVYGNGDLIGYGIRQDNWDSPALFRWDHEDDSRTWVAPDLQTWFEWTYRCEEAP